MSTVDALFPGGSVGSAQAGRPSKTRVPPPVRAWLRLARSEVGLVFRRRRNQVLLVVVAVVPVIIGVALRLAGSPHDNGGGPPFFGQVSVNGLAPSFASLISLLALLPMWVGSARGRDS